MKLSNAQSYAVFYLMKEELNSNRNKEIKRRIAFNKQLDADAMLKFKETPEYAAFLLLNSTFKHSIFLRDWSNMIEIAANTMFEVSKNKLSEFVSIQDERGTIELLSIDCKNTKELFEVLNKHYGLKKKLTIENYKLKLFKAQLNIVKKK